MDFTLDSIELYQHSKKYQNKFNFYFSKSINEIVFNQTLAISTIKFKDAAIYAQSIQYLKRIYFIINKDGYQQIFQRIHMLAGFYAGAILLRYEYPLMIITDTKQIFLKRLKRNKKMLTQQGSSDESQSKTQSKQIQLHTNTFLNSVNSSELSKKTCELQKQNQFSNLIGYSNHLNNSYNSDQYQQIHNIHNPKKESYELQQQSSSIFNQSFAEKLLRLSKNVSLTDLIDKQTIQINLKPIYQQIQHLCCDFQEIDQQIVLQNYQKIKQKRLKLNKNNKNNNIGCQFPQKLQIINNLNKKKISNLLMRDSNHSNFNYYTTNNSNNNNNNNNNNKNKNINYNNYQTNSNSNNSNYIQQLKGSQNNTNIKMNQHTTNTNIMNNFKKIKQMKYSQIYDNHNQPQLRTKLYSEYEMNKNYSNNIVNNVYEQSEMRNSFINSNNNGCIAHKSNSNKNGNNFYREDQYLLRYNIGNTTHRLNNINSVDNMNDMNNVNNLNNVNNVNNLNNMNNVNNVNNLINNTTNYPNSQQINDRTIKTKNFIKQSTQRYNIDFYEQSRQSNKYLDNHNPYNINDQKEIIKLQRHRSNNVIGLNKQSQFIHKNNKNILIDKNSHLYCNKNHNNRNTIYQNQNQRHNFDNKNIINKNINHNNKNVNKINDFNNINPNNINNANNSDKQKQIYDKYPAMKKDIHHKYIIDYVKSDNNTNNNYPSTKFRQKHTDLQNNHNNYLNKNNNKKMYSPGSHTRHVSPPIGMITANIENKYTDYQMNMQQQIVYDDKVEKKRRIRQKAAQLLHRVRSQQYLTGKTSSQYITYSHKNREH